MPMFRDCLPPRLRDKTLLKRSQSTCRANVHFHRHLREVPGSMNNFASADLNYLDSVSIIWTSCLAGWNPMLGFVCRWPLLSVTYAMNMFGHSVASSIVSFDAPNLFEA